MSSIVDSGFLARYYEILGRYQSFKENKEKINDLFNWIDENSSGHPGIYTEFVRVDDLKKKIKELFDI